MIYIPPLLPPPVHAVGPVNDTLAVCLIVTYAMCGIGYLIIIGLIVRDLWRDRKGVDKRVK